MTLYRTMEAGELVYTGAILRPQLFQTVGYQTVGYKCLLPIWQGTLVRRSGSAQISVGRPSAGPASLLPAWSARASHARHPDRELQLWRNQD